MIQIGKRSDAVYRMDEAMRLPEVLMEGNRAIREEASEWLPQAEREPDNRYQQRIKGSYLWPYYSDTVKKLAATPFKQKYKLAGMEEGQRLPDPIAELFENADRQGADFGQFARRRMREMIDRGWTVIQVDLPKLPENASQADVERLRVHPYFPAIRARDIMRAEAGRTEDGRVYLAEIHVRSETFREGERQVRITVYKDDGAGSLTWERHLGVRSEAEGGGEAGKTTRIGRYRVDETMSFALEEEGTLPDSLEELPFIFLACDPDCGFWEAYPPLEELAFLNLAHYQSDSAQRAYLKVARVPILNRRRATSQAVMEGITLSASLLLDSTEDTELEFVETKGNAMEAGRADLEALEAAMKAISMQPEILRERTATEVASDDSKAGSLLHDWVGTLEAGLTKAIVLAARMAGYQTPEGFAVQLFREFGIHARAAGSAEIIKSLMSESKLATVDGLRELQGIGVISSGQTAEDLAERAAAEVPAGLVGLENRPPGADDGDGGDE